MTFPRMTLPPLDASSSWLKSIKSNTFFCSDVLIFGLYGPSSCWTLPETQPVSSGGDWLRISTRLLNFFNFNFPRFSSSCCIELRCFKRAVSCAVADSQVGSRALDVAKQLNADLYSSSNFNAWNKNTLKTVSTDGIDVYVNHVVLNCTQRIINKRNQQLIRRWSIYIEYVMRVHVLNFGMTYLEDSQCKY